MHHAGVEARDLQQILDQLPEAVDVGHHQVEGGPGPFGHVLAVVLQHGDRRRQRGQRGSQLVADVGGEAGVPLDPGLQRRRHLVERGRQRGQVGVGAGLDPGLEVAAGQVERRAPDPPQRAQHPAGRPDAQAGTAQRGDDGRRDQRQPQGLQVLLDLVERGDLEVGGVDVGVELEPHGQVHVAAVRVAHPGVLALLHHLDQVLGQGILAEGGVGRVPVVPVEENRVGPGGAGQVVEQVLRLRYLGGDALGHLAGVGHGQPGGAVRPLVELVLAGEGPRPDGQQRRQEERTDRERDRDAGPQSQPRQQPRSSHVWSL
jgi:hypothetical protein